MTQDRAAYCKQYASLHPNHLRLIQASGISARVSQERGYRTETVKTHVKSLKFSPAQCRTPALLIPVYGVDGQCAGYQLRPDEPRIKTGKPVKYETPRGMRMVLDCHPCLSRRRANPNAHMPGEPAQIPALIADLKVPLLVTEGVRKADAATSVDLCCLALLGVWNWRGSNENGGTTALPDWESVALKDRLVYIAYDSDVMLKPEVSAALSRLRAFLESRGATVRLIYLPPGPHGEKVGLDDWIAARKIENVSEVEIRRRLFDLATEEMRIAPRDEVPEDERPAIEVQAGLRPWMVDRAEEVIRDYKRWNLFQRGGTLCRVVEIDPSDGDHKSIRRPEGAVVIKTVDSVTLEDVFSRAIRWWKYNAKSEPLDTDCPPKVATTYLSRTGAWRLPVLAGVIEAPTILSNGTIVESPGFDPVSGLFLYSRERWTPVPESPTRAETEAALRTLREPFDEFPFVSEEDRSVVLSAILTGLIRRQLISAPIHGLDAPAQGSGKSLAVDCVALILTGRPVASMPLGGDTEEIRKRITSILLAGDLIVNIDNIVRPLKSDALAMVLTQPFYADRILGRNERPRLPTNVLWFATGNNLTFAGDMTTRGIISRIDAKREDPEDRSFKIGDLRSHVRSARTNLVRAALTILRAYYVAGSPNQAIHRFGRFEQWSDWPRSALVWLGCADPCKTRERITLNDPERATTATVLGAWHTLFQDKMMLLRHVVAELEPTSEPEIAGVREARAELREALLNFAASANNPQKVDTKRLASWCRDNTDRVAGGLRLTRGDVRRHKTATWSVVVPEGDQADSTGHDSLVEILTPTDGANRPEIVTAKTNPSDPCHPPNGDARPTLSTNSTGEIEDLEIDRLAGSDGWQTRS